MLGEWGYLKEKEKKKGKRLSREATVLGNGVWGERYITSLKG